MKTSFYCYIFWIISFAFGGFFVYSGVKKFLPSKRPFKTETAVKAVIGSPINKPEAFKTTMYIMRQSGFLKMVGVLQIFGGLGLFFGITRFLGLMFLLPVTINIFSFHVFMDNRPDELVETGLLLLVNVLLLSVYWRALKVGLNLQLYFKKKPNA
jgi:putative oxidoreductase